MITVLADLMVLVKRKQQKMCFQFSNLPCENFQTVLPLKYCFQTLYYALFKFTRNEKDSKNMLIT